MRKNRGSGSRTRQRSWYKKCVMYGNTSRMRKNHPHCEKIVLCRSSGKSYKKVACVQNRSPMNVGRAHSFTAATVCLIVRIYRRIVGKRFQQSRSDPLPLNILRNMESTQQSKKQPVLRYTITNQTMTYKAPSCGVVFLIISETNRKIKKINKNNNTPTKERKKTWEELKI